MEINSTLKSLRSLECDYLKKLSELAADNFAAASAYTGMSFETCKRLSKFRSKHAVNLERSFQANTSTLLTLSKNFPWTKKSKTSVIITDQRLAVLRQIERKIALVIRDVVLLDSDVAVICCGINLKIIEKIKSMACHEFLEASFSACVSESMLGFRMRESDLARVIDRCDQPIFEKMGLTLNRVVRHENLCI